MSDEDLTSGRTQQQPPTLRELVVVLFRRRRVFVSVTALVLTTAVLFAVFGTTYQANMKVIVRRGRADAPVSAGENAPLDLTRVAVAEEELNSEVELLRGADVLRKVVEEIGVGQRDWLHLVRPDESDAQRVERAVRRLAKKIRVEPVKKTNLISISCTTSDPQMAQRVLQSLARTYLEKHKAVHRPSGELHFFEQQLDESRLELENSKQRLLQFTTTHGAIAAGLQRDLAVQKLSEMDGRDRQSRIDLAETAQRVADLRRMLQTLPERTTTQVRTADNPELLKALKSGLLDLQLKRTQLLTKFEPGHRLVQEVDQQIAQARSAITAESATPVRDEATDRDPHYEWAKSELEKSQVQLQALRARVAATSSQTVAYRSVATKFGEDAIAQDDLLSNEKAALDNYLLYVKKQEEARMNDALDERGIVNVAIAEQPVAPALPVWSAAMVLIVGFFAAGAAGTSAAFVADYLDPAFRDPEDVLTFLKVPVLASLPRDGRGRLSA
jgi:succinoglycan biosynthesis transport protein ExoP